LGAVCFFLYEFSSGHGGQYRGPGDIVPPNVGGPGGNTPPTIPGGPATPGPAGPSTAGPKGPSTAGPGTIGPRGVTTGSNARKRSRPNEGFDRWEFWWELNKEPYLMLKNHLNKGGSVSGSSSWLVGLGSKSKGRNTKRPGPRMIKEIIIPSLKQALETDNMDMQDSAILSLARITRAQNADLVIDDIFKLLGSPHRSAQESATISLGVLGANNAIPNLRSLMTDSAKGHKLVNRSHVPQMVRSFAALSMGLINNPQCVDYLFQVIDMERDNERDLKSCAITALGLMKNNTRHEEIISKLINLMADRKLDPLIKSNIPIALGKLGDPIATPSLISCFKQSKLNNYIRQSCAIGIGRLASIEDDDAVDTLIKYIKKGKDVQARHFSYIALGQIGARDLNFDQNRKRHDKLLCFFLKEIVKPKKSTHQPWAVLAAAIYGQKHERFQGDLIEKVTSKYDRCHSHSYRGAFAIALGILNAQSKGEFLFNELRNTKDTLLRGYLCVSLGLINYKNSGEYIREIIRTRATNYTMRLQAATALGLMGDADAVDILVKTLQNGRTLTVTSSAAQALGRIGDVGAIKPLNAVMLGNENPIARAFAAVALGIVGEKTDLPWNSVISENSNYRAKTEAIAEILDIL